MFRKLKFKQNEIVTITDYTEWTIAISGRTGFWNWHHCCMSVSLHEGLRQWWQFSRCVWRVDRSGSGLPCSETSFTSNLLWGEFRYHTDIDFRSNPTPYRHFRAFATAWLLAVNTSAVHMPLPLTKLTLLSTKFAFCILLRVWISMIQKEGPFPSDSFLAPKEQR